MEERMNGRQVGKRFRMAVAFDLASSGATVSTDRADWLTANGEPIALRYSKRHTEGGRTSWFYGLRPSDVEALQETGSLLFVMPGAPSHKFARLTELETKALLSRCSGSERGDLKIHLSQDTDGTCRVQEWPELDLAGRVRTLSAAAVSAAGLTPEMSLVSAESDEAAFEERETFLVADATRTARTPRPFDGTRVPSLESRSSINADPSETLARREKAHRAHHHLVAALDALLRAERWTEVEEMPGAIDLWGRRPKDGARVIFECKSVDAAKPASELSRCRLGMAQLLEYRFEHGQPSDFLCLATNGPVSARRVQYLESVGIGCISIVDGVVQFLGTLSRPMLGAAPGP
jgi:hypothetical protein